MGLLARALPGTPLETLRRLGKCLAWSLIHSSGILHGEQFIWPDLRLSRVGRTFLKVQQLRARPLHHWAAKIDL